MNKLQALCLAEGERVRHTVRGDLGTVTAVIKSYASVAWDNGTETDEDFSRIELAPADPS